MKFSIITPSFRNSEWLKLCIASVADQAVPHEHIVQDAGSDDGTLDWLLQDPRVRAFVEKDSGMYDAINRGLRKASGDILAYLNCDEQYLPGALAQVQDYFENHPEVEVVFADALVVDPQGRYLCHRQALLPNRYHGWVSRNLAILTCATFFRRSVIEKRGLFFDTRLKACGDAEWVSRLVEGKVPMGLLGAVTSTFTDTGENLALTPQTLAEIRQRIASAPAWARLAKPLIVLHHRWRRFRAGHYSPKPITYAIYTRQSPERRVEHRVDRPTFRWRRSFMEENR